MACETSAENGFVKAVVVPSSSKPVGELPHLKHEHSAVSAATRPSGWVCLAQVHSHPGAFVEHSRYDDENASSQRILSMVIPNYGRWRRRWPKGLGVHECQNEYWHQLSDSDATLRVQIEPGREKVTFIDLRR